MPPHSPLSLEDRLEAIRKHCDHEHETIQIFLHNNGDIEVFLDGNDSEEPDITAENFADAVDEIEAALQL